MPFTVDPLDPAEPPLPIDLAEPDAPAPVGDRWPCHVFWAPLAEPLPPVLRVDRPYCPTAHAVQLGLLSPDVLARWRAAGCPMGPLEPGRLPPKPAANARSGMLRCAAVAVSLASIAYSIGYIMGTALN